MTFNSRRRAPAIKLNIGDLTSGELVTEQDGSKVLHVKTDDIIRRARILGTITNKVDIETDESVIIDVEDGTGSIKVRGGGSEWAGQIYLEMKDLKEGMTVDVVGLIRESSDGSIYINCEMCLIVTDTAVKVLRELEISKYYERKGLKMEATKTIEHAIKDQVKLVASDEIKDQIVELLKQDDNIEEGLTFDEIKRALGLTTKELEPELRELQNDGDIFEPIPGTFKYV
ncbi:MAG: hypothetical protein FK734_02205 [Asgard group archaeon]|nr:hypothetical protein [Asgard group archaeon]